MTYFQLKKYIKDSLSEIAEEYTAYEAEKILCHLFGVDKRALTLLYHEEAPDKIKDAENIVARRKNGEPLAYILENADFFGLNLYVNSSCLTPRADTEVIVEKALEFLGDRKARVLDVCTGSGCIALAIGDGADADVLGIDVSEDALSVARKNAERCGLSQKVRFEKCDALSDELLRTGEQYDLIVSNPPYIPTADIEGLSPEVRHEPMLALDGGSDGLIFYRRFLDAFPKMLREGGAIIFEFGYDQGDAIASLCADKGFECEIFRDYGGNVRGAVIKP
jgi:release factor glutamine methyltransferase